ncbi:UDP-N-acetylmuramoyl-tripeptide--D-alanyl-D-alanine ligase [Ruania halotolerans]|uniref:UDP-N-acetylmuramoyl-tripeptide--D-alanyl-D- alanine ligase n=1 Tax=Ruania halotolerans TaxID=2897773 RepID=UPI001E3E7580|nr:UDP-N-acetylmuramoyl-tripeptide--D-alanyl-D-alanine ligase [Ruania halotolerans]UFU05125.1 UDP-N-acetylmuramoyl-tripeptide--D-alanyl-D-alanine ligase [Ruania halotolerans]
MITLTLAEIAAATGGKVLAAATAPPLQEEARRSAGATSADAVQVTGATVIDSRDVGAGDLFVAVPGERVDGHDYLHAAADRGAVAALVSRHVPGSPVPMVLVADAQIALGVLAREVLARLRSAGELTVVAITGSVGKTTTKDLLAQLLTPLGGLIAPAGSFNNELGLPLTVLRATPSTRVLVLEMGADAPGNLTYLTSIAPPDIAVVLAVGTAHLGGFGSVEGIARAKAELVQGLRPDGVAVLNADDVRVAAMSALSAGAQVRTFGTGPDAEVRAEEVSVDATGRAAFTLSIDGVCAPVQVALVGGHHVTNALAAAAVCLTLGLSVEEVAQRLAHAGALSPHRMHVRTWGERTVIDDAYNANPDSMRAALDALTAIAAGRRTVAVLGEMLELGDIAEQAHEQIGAYAAEHADMIVVVGAGADGIARGARSAGAQVRTVADVKEAEELVVTDLGPEDVVLIKSSNSAGLAVLADRLVADAGDAEELA